MMLDGIVKNGIKLAIFAAITTSMTAAVDIVTKPTIMHQISLQQKILLDRVVPPELYDNHIQQECYIVSNLALGNASSHHLYLARKGEKQVAVAVESTAPDGYSGEIQIIVGADFNGTVYGTQVVEHHETPGLGDKIELRISNWIMGFNGKKIIGPEDTHFAVKKDGGDFDQFTGATITPRAVVNAVKNTTLYIKTLPGKLSSLPPCGATNG